MIYVSVSLARPRARMLQYGERQPLDDWRDQRRIALRRNIGQFSHRLNVPAQSSEHRRNNEP
jgi:hypothetical protein